MKTKSYIIEFNKLRFGKNELNLPIQAELLSELAEKPFQSINAACEVMLDKKDSMYEIQFNMKGNVLTTCDTCLDDFNLPISKTFNLLIKLIDGPENLDDDEIIYLPKGIHEFDFKQFIYDYFLLSIPSKISCEDANKEHNQAFIDKLKIDEGKEEENNNESDPRWDALKNFYNKN